MSDLVKQDDQWDEEKIKLLKTSLMPQGATDQELSLFVKVCERTKLDPFSRQIYPLKRWDSAKRREVISFQCSIDGFRVIAERSGDYAGQLGPFWCGPDGKWVDVWVSEDPPYAAKVGVLKNSFKEPLWSVAKFSEYKQTKRDGSLNSMWEKMGANQLAKCAESLALRRAFPNDLSGLYTADEMAQSQKSDEPVKRKTTSAPNALESIHNDLAERDSGDHEVVSVQEPVESKTDDESLTEEEKKMIQRQEQIDARTAKMDELVRTGKLDLAQSPSKKMLAEIMTARGFNDEEIVEKFRVHIHGKYNADKWSDLNKSQQRKVVQDAVDGAIDDPIPF